MPIVASPAHVLDRAKQTLSPVEMKALLLLFLILDCMSF